MFRFFLTLILLSLCFFGAKVYPGQSDKNLRPRATNLVSQWTCILYLAGDNFLDWFVLQHLEELKKAGSSYDIRVMALVDRTDRQGYLYEVRKDYLVDIPLEAVDPSWKGKELNTGDPQTLAAFGSWAVENLPARNYCLILGGYGEGWMGLLHDFDDGRGQVDILTLDELEGALAQIAQGIKKVNGKPRLDILGLDSCYMGMVEVLYQIGGYARYVVASENEEALDGWPYGKIIETLITAPYQPESRIVSSIVDSYIDSAHGEPTKLGNILTVSAIDLEEFKAILDPLEALALGLKEVAPRETRRLLEIDRHTSAFTVSAHIAGRYVPYSMHYDLKEFLEAIVTGFKDNPSLIARAEKVRESLSRAVIKERHQDLPNRHLSLGGLTIYGMGAETEGYKRLAFSRKIHWHEFVEAKMESLEKAIKGK